MFTWSFGCTGLFEPTSPPRIWFARFEITSFAFMFVDVPEPVWKMSSTKCRSSSPSITSREAWRIAPARRASSRPRSSFTLAAACLIAPSARRKRRSKRSRLIGKFWRARSV
jgi:hypothetical protein